MRVSYWTDLCPCGSGELMRKCCLATRARTDPGLPRTGNSHPGCYARTLRDCSEKLSREYWISQSILDLGDSMIVARGLPWLKPGESRRISSKSLAARILCTRHNSALSSLDHVGLRVWEHLV